MKRDRDVFENGELRLDMELEMEYNEIIGKESEEMIVKSINKK